MSWWSSIRLAAERIDSGPLDWAGGEMVAESKGGDVVGRGFLDSRGLRVDRSVKAGHHWSPGEANTKPIRLPGAGV